MSNHVQVRSMKENFHPLSLNSVLGKTKPHPCHRKGANPLKFLILPQIRNLTWKVPRYSWEITHASIFCLNYGYRNQCQDSRVSSKLSNFQAKLEPGISSAGLIKNLLGLKGEVPVPMVTLKPYLTNSSSLQCKDLSLQTYLPCPAFPTQEHGPSSCSFFFFF